jgi:Tol biopolymer transport system component
VRSNESLVDAPRLAAGSRLGAFEILNRLGTGGMGEVYRARDTRLERFVAIKVLSRAIDLAPRGRERFEREARAISKLSHSHICTVHDVGAAQVDGHELPFLVLELLDGETLAARLARGPLSVRQALDYAIDMADAVATAHAQGIVHRDLKPSNVMVTASGVKLLDFGLAQLRAPEGAGDGVPAAPGDPLTSAGMVVGTPPYMSPEQVEGRKVDARSDIFSFGSVLYEMLTGQRAFAGNATRSAAAQILADEPTPVNELLRSVPADLAKVVSHCLRKDPARRYQYIADVKVALEDVREESRSRPQAQTTDTGSRWQWAWLMLLVPVVLVSGYFAWPRQSPPAAPPARPVPLTTLQGSEGSPTLAPDGEQVAFTWSGPREENEDIYVQRIGSGTEVRRTDHPARDFSPAWSPDGRWIAFLRGEVPGRSELILVPPLGGAEHRVGELHIRQSIIVPPYLSWFPDSRALVIVHSPAPGQAEGLFVMSIETGEKHALTLPRAGDPDNNPSVSPDGRTVTFRRGATLCVVAVGHDLKAVTEPRVLGAGNAFQPTWTPDGKEIVYSQGRSLWRLDPSGERPPTQLPFGGQDAIMPVLSGSIPGKPTRLVYVRRTADHNLWRLDLPGFATATSSEPVLFKASSTMADSSPQFSPDGKRVAFESSRTGRTEVWVADADGANAVSLAAVGRYSGSPRWSRDSKRIAFDASTDGHWDVYVVSADGGKPQRITHERTSDARASFSRDGTSLYFNSNRNGEFQIWKVPLSGGAPVQITRNGGFVGVESSDGRHLFYTQTATGSSALWQIPTAGGEPRKLVDNVSEGAFVVLDNGIYYVERQGANNNTGAYLSGGLVFSNPNARPLLRFFDFASTKPRTLADLGERVGRGLAVSPDGRTILFTRADSPASDLMMVENFR